MKTIIFFVILLANSVLLGAQTPDSTGLTTTVHPLTEVEVTGSHPLNTKDVVDFYRPNYFSTIDDLMSRLSGLALIKRGPYAQEPQLGGFSDGQINVTIDGMHLFGACTDHMDPVSSYIEPTNLKNIKITKGPQGCASGCTVGGSVDFSLSEPDTSAITTNLTSIGYGYQSVSEGSNVLLTTGAAGTKWAAGLEGGYRKNNVYKAGNNLAVPYSQFEKVNLHTSVKFMPNRRDMYKADLLYDDAWDVGYPALPMDVSSAKAWLGALEYRRDGDMPLRAKIYYNQVRHVMDDSHRDSLIFVDTDNDLQKDSVYMRMDMPGQTRTTGAFAETTISIDHCHTLFVKAEGYSTQKLAEMTMTMRPVGSQPEMPMYMQTWPESARLNTGIYVQWSWFVTNNWLLKLSSRGDYYRDVLLSDIGNQQLSVFYGDVPETQNHLTKNLNVTSDLHLNKKMALVATLGYGERMPTTGEQTGYYLYNAYDGFDYIGNPFLKPEKSMSARVGILWHNDRLNLNIDQTVSAIDNTILGDVDTLIPPLNYGAKGTKRYVNAGFSLLYSGEANLLWDMSTALTVIEVMKFTYGQFTTGDAMPMLPPLKNVVAIQYKLTKQTLMAEWEATLPQSHINKSFGETATAGFSVFNIKYGIDVPMKQRNMNISLAITNLFDAYYYEHLDWGQMPRPGRSFDLFVKYSF